MSGSKIAPAGVTASVIIWVKFGNKTPDAYTLMVRVAPLAAMFTSVSQFE